MTRTIHFIWATFSGSLREELHRKVTQEGMNLPIPTKGGCGPRKWKPKF